MPREQGAQLNTLPIPSQYLPSLSRTTISFQATLCLAARDMHAGMVQGGVHSSRRSDGAAPGPHSQPYTEPTAAPFPKIEYNPLPDETIYEQKVAVLEEITARSSSVCGHCPQVPGAHTPRRRRHQHAGCQRRYCCVLTSEQLCLLSVCNSVYISSFAYQHILCARSFFLFLSRRYVNNVAPPPPSRCAASSSRHFPCRKGRLCTTGRGRAHS